MGGSEVVGKRHEGDQIYKEEETRTMEREGAVQGAKVMDMRKRRGRWEEK
jgi:hypothetical protein